MSKSNDKISYEIPEPSYLKFNPSLIEGKHKDLPNPYYRQKEEISKQRIDYAHPTADVIRSIVNEYGTFSNLTEEKLEELLNSENDSMMDIDKDDTQRIGKAQNPNIDNHDLEFYKRRDEMLKHVRTALGASTWSLDFVSLLISSVRPTTGSSSMSPHVKQSLKLGSLSCDRIYPKPTNKDEGESKKQQEAAKVGHGWKVQSLQKASEYIKNAVNRMRQDLEKEKIYWKEAMDVLDAHELITTAIAPVDVPKSIKSGAPSSQGNAAPQKVIQKKVLAVRYGYADSGSTYFDSGLALLKKTKSGHLGFEKLNVNEREKAWGGEYVVNVKLFKKPISNTETPELVGQSNINKIIEEEIVTDDESFVSKVNNHRFFIFENELFWHLMKEASSLVSHKIQVLDSVIIIELFDKIIHIEKVDANDEPAKHPPPEMECNGKADDLLLFFKILLCANNFKNLQKQNVPPVAMTNDSTSTKSNKNAVLIRPIIMYSEHNRMIEKLKRLMIKLLVDLDVPNEEAARIIKEELAVKKYVNDPNELQQFKNSKRCYNNDPFLKVNSKMAPTSLIILKHFGMKIWIELVSNYTTLHISMNVKVTNSASKETVLESTFTTKRDVYNCLLWILKDSKTI